MGGAGQQSRVDCVKLAGRKVATWRVRFIEGDMQPTELAEWNKSFEDASAIIPLTDVEKTEFLSGLDGVAISSDAFFPFRDSIDHAAKIGVKYVAQPGGSNADAEVI